MSDQLPAVLAQQNMTLQDTLTLGETLAKSGFFSDAKTAAQACVKVLAGRELGFGPMASMSGVNIIEGKPSIGAHLMAAAIKRSDRYDYKILKLDRTECSLEFWERTLEKGGETRKGRPGWVKADSPVVVTFAEVEQSGVATAIDKASNKPYVKANWRRHPDDMLFARAISKGYRRYCPDLTSGVLVYTTEEMTDGEVIDGGTLQNSTPAPASPPPSNPAPAASPAPTAQSSATAAVQQPDEISDSQNAHLAKLIKDVIDAGGQVNVPILLKHFGIPALQKLPASRFDELKQILEAKLVTANGVAPAPSAPQPAAASPMTATEEGEKRQALQKEIDTFIEQLRFNPTEFKAHLKALFGVEDPTKLKTSDLVVLRDRLAQKAAQTATSAKAG